MVNVLGILWRQHRPKIKVQTKNANKNQFSALQVPREPGDESGDEDEDKDDNELMLIILLISYELPMNSYALLLLPLECENHHCHF